MTGRRGRGKGASKAPGAPASQSPPGAARRPAHGDAAAATKPPPASAQTTRVTRSQSREAEPEPQVEVPRRGTRRNVREQSVQSIRSNTSRVTSVDAALSQPQGVLDTVVEEPSSTPRSARKPASPQLRRSAARGSVELTPGRGTARPKLRRTFFESVFRAADDLQRHNADHSDDDESDYETWTLLHESYKSALRAIRAPIHRAVPGDDYYHYIPVSDVLGAVEGDDVDRQDAATSIAAGNIATLLDDLVDGELSSLVDTIDSVFPTAFVPANVPALADWLEANRAALVDLALDLRTQRFIEIVRDQGPDADLPLELTLLFCDEDAVDDAWKDSNNWRAWAKVLEQGPYRNFDDLNLDVNDDDDLRGAYYTRIAKIRSFLTGPFEHADLDGLERAFPSWAATDSLKSWALSGLNAIRTSRLSRTAGSSPSLFVDAPDHQDAVSEGLGSQDESQPVRRAPESQTGPRALDANDVGLLMQLERNPAAEIPAAEIPASDAASSIDFTNEDLVRRSKLLSSQNPPRSSMPRASNYGALYAGAAVAATDRKRAFEPAFDPSQFDDDDDEFEQDGRVPNSQRRVQPAAEPTPKKVRIDELRLAPRPPRPDSYAAPPPQASNPGGGAEPSSSALPPPPSYNHPDLAALSQMSRQQSLLYRKPKAPQTRHRWSPHDMELLIMAVDAYKAKWSVIERAGAEGTLRFEQPRDQQGLRDKARNIKVDLLKTNSVLPPSFDLVVLGKKERQAVIDVGKNPDRREADIVNGQPINTQYQQDHFA